MRWKPLRLKNEQALINPRKAPGGTRSIRANAMHYTNLHTRLNFHPALSPAMLKRIEECRQRSRKARTHAEKIALATASRTPQS